MMFACTGYMNSSSIKDSLLMIDVQPSPLTMFAVVHMVPISWTHVS